MAENFPVLARDVNLQIQEADQNENRINPKKSIQNHVTLNFPNTKSKDLKAEKNDILSIGENSNDSGFLMSNNGNQKELT